MHNLQAIFRSDSVAPSLQCNICAAIWDMTGLGLAFEADCIPVPGVGMNQKSYTIDEIEEGMEAVFSKTVSHDDIVAFAEVTGDTNPVHLDDAYAESTFFKGRIAHGMLTAGFFSTVFGTKLPGPGSIYLSQTLRFRGPVRIGDEVTASVRVHEIDRDRRRVTFMCECKVGEDAVLDGEALIMVPARGA